LNKSGRGPGIAPPRLLIRPFVRTGSANPLFHVRSPRTDYVTGA